MSVAPLLPRIPPSPHYCRLRVLRLHHHTAEFVPKHIDGLGILLSAEIATGVVGIIGILLSLWFVALSNARPVLTQD